MRLLEFIYFCYLKNKLIYIIVATEIVAHNFEEYGNVDGPRPDKNPGPFRSRSADCRGNGKRIC